MSVLRLPSRSLTLPPQISSGINWSNPLAVGLRDSVVPALGVTGKGITFNRFPGFPRVSSGMRGPVLYNNAFDNGNASVVPIRGDWAPNPPYTVSNTFYLGGDEGAQFYVGSSYASNNGGWRFRVDPGRILTSYITRSGLGEGVTITHGTALDLFRLYTATIVVRPTTYDLYIDGVLSIGGVAHSALGLVNGSVHPFGSGGTQYGGRSGCYNLSVWNRCLSPTEVLEQSRNPWQVYGTSSKYLDIQPRQYLTPSVSRKLGTSTGVLPTVAPLVLSRPLRTSQPQGPVGIDWENPVTKGLRVAYGFQGSACSNTGVAASPVGSFAVLSPIATPFGIGIHEPASVSGLPIKIVVPISGSPERLFFVVVAIKNGSVTNANKLYLASTHPNPASQGGAGNGNLAIYWLNVSGERKLGVFYQGFAAPQTLEVLGVSDGLHVIAASSGANTTRNIWLDGNLISSMAPTESAFSGDTSIYNASFDAPSFSTAGVGSVLLKGFFAGAKNSTQAPAFTRNPWQIFAPTPRNIWVPYV